MQLTLRFSPRESLPKAGDTVLMQGMAGTYRIRIHRILSRKENKYGDPLLVIEGTRELIGNRPVEAYLQEARPVSSPHPPKSKPGRILRFPSPRHRR